MKIENRFSAAWREIESTQPPPQRFRRLVVMSAREFEEEVLKQRPSFVDNIVGSLYAGDSYIIKGVFAKDFMLEIRNKVHELWNQTPSSFHKMTEDCPNFHRVIDATVSGKYYANPLKHSYYFFPWNRDSLNLFERIRKKWRLFKCLGGLDFDQYNSNTPKDGIIDRIQVVNYPSGGGKIDTHWDPYNGMKPVLSTYMSKRGVDYQSGGFYLIDQQDRVVDVEDHIDVGDMGFTFPTVAHGMAAVDPGIEPDFQSMQGRWWLGMFSISSDLVQNRPTGGVVHVPDVTLNTGAVATMEPNDS